MKHLSITITLVVFLAVGSASFAAPVESVGSGRSVAIHQINSFLSAQAVVKQMQALGLTKEEVAASVAKLDDAQIDLLAQQINLLQAGGTIQGGAPRMGLFEKLFKGVGSAFYSFYKYLFTWSDIRYRTSGELYPTQTGYPPAQPNTFRWAL